jgi:hypothetical protein
LFDRLLDAEFWTAAACTEVNFKMTIVLSNGWNGADWLTQNENAMSWACKGLRPTDRKLHHTTLCLPVRSGEDLRSAWNYRFRSGLPLTLAAHRFRFKFKSYSWSPRRFLRRRHCSGTRAYRWISIPSLQAGKHAGRWSAH